MTYDQFPGHLPLNVCGPATPGSPFELPGLGFSEFARHYYRNHGCFLFLWVLRWFTSPGSPRIPMYSECDNCCSQQLGFPIRTSPDHRLLASPRSLSQLVTSFIAYLRQGIHTHALSSLTIKLTLDTNLLIATYRAQRLRCAPITYIFTSAPRRILAARRDCNLCCPSIFNCQRSKTSVQKPGVGTLWGFDS